jgi:hypothetical protein
MNKNAKCEIKKNGSWELVSVDEARALGSSERKRCPECHGKVRAMRAGGDTPAHFEHAPKHNGCSLSHRFDGSRRPHPDPIE